MHQNFLWNWLQSCNRASFEGLLIVVVVHVEDDSHRTSVVRWFLGEGSRILAFNQATTLKSINPGLKLLELDFIVLNG